MLKAAGSTMVQWLKEVLYVAWRCGKMLQEWREAIIVPIQKTGCWAEWVINKKSAIY